MPVLLPRVLAALESVAPLALAADWDNVGLLVDPPGARRRVRAILLAIDCTAPVVEEALARRCDLVVAYHPPIFAGLKALSARDPRTAALLTASRAGLRVYSPHTALDAVPGGVNDWLAVPFGRATASALAPAAGGPLGSGQGRRLELAQPATLPAVVRRVRAHLGAASLRLARGLGPRRRGIRVVGLVPGSGGDLLVPLARNERVDLVLSGEMRHHDVLAVIETGCHVLLAEHTTTERGYLPRLRAALRARLGAGIAVEIARRDRDPLETVR